MNSIGISWSSLRHELRRLIVALVVAAVKTPGIKLYYYRIILVCEVLDYMDSRTYFGNIKK